MVEKISIGIELEGGPELQRQFAAATSSIAKLGNTAEEAFAGAAAAAQKFSASTAELGQVEGVIRALAARAKDSSLSFAELAKNYDAARQSASSFVPAAEQAAQATAKVAAATKTMSTSASETRGAVNALAQGLNVMGAGPMGQIATAVANIGARFGALALAATAVGGTAAALIKFANAAQETEKALTQLQKVSGLSFANLSALSNAFAQGGTPLKQFATEFGNLSEKIAAAGEQAAKQDAISKQAEDAAKGLKVTELGAITLNERVTALLETLSRVPETEQWFKLADIFKQLGDTGQELERTRIGKALGLSPESIATLSLGSAKLRAMADEAKQLGVALNDVDKNNLSGLRAGQTQAGALFDSLKDKMGALVAPALTSFWEGFTARLKELIPVFTQIASSVGQMDFSSIGAAAANFLAILAQIGAGWAAIISGQQSFKDVLVQLFQEAGSALASMAVTIGVSIGEGIINGIASALADAGTRMLQALGLTAGAPIGGPGGGIGHAASGGLLGGRGTGTSDSNLAWVSRGEYVTPARAVAQPGVLAFLEALRRSGGNLRGVLDGMGRFALGGMVPRAMPAFAGGGAVGSMSHVTIAFPGLPAISGLRASSAVVDELHRAAALAQVRSGGRKPSRYS